MVLSDFVLLFYFLRNILSRIKGLHRLKRGPLKRKFYYWYWHLFVKFLKLFSMALLQNTLDWLLLKRTRVYVLKYQSEWEWNNTRKKISLVKDFSKKTFQERLFKSKSLFQPFYRKLTQRSCSFVIFVNTLMPDVH